MSDGTEWISSDEPETSASSPEPATGLSTPEPPQTGDIVVDAALAELAGTDPDDLDAQLVAGESVQRTLQARLADLGG